MPAETAAELIAEANRSIEKWAPDVSDPLRDVTGVPIRVGTLRRLVALAEAAMEMRRVLGMRAHEGSNLGEELLRWDALLAEKPKAALLPLEAPECNDGDDCCRYCGRGLQPCGACKPVASPPDVREAAEEGRRLTEIITEGEALVAKGHASYFSHDAGAARALDLLPRLLAVARAAVEMRADLGKRGMSGGSLAAFDRAAEEGVDRG